MSERTAWQDDHRMREERAEELRERDRQREPRAPFRRRHRAHGGDDLQIRLTETIAQPETEERTDESPDEVANG